MQRGHEHQGHANVHRQCSIVLDIGFGPLWKVMELVLRILEFALVRDSAMLPGSNIKLVSSISSTNSFIKLGMRIHHAVIDRRAAFLAVLHDAASWN